jgi:metal-responsive CopG/Arc/MetJ family transcriptional regulator
VRKQYVNVKIPVELADEVDKILEKKLLGCRSRAEFVAEGDQRQAHLGEEVNKRAKDSSPVCLPHTPLTLSILQQD